MTELIDKIKELEKSFANSKNNSAIIFDEAKNLVIDLNKLKVKQSEVELLSRIINILQTLYY